MKLKFKYVSDASVVFLFLLSRSKNPLKAK